MNDWVAGRLSSRRLSLLIAELPSEGTAYHRAVVRAMPADARHREPPEEWWTPERDFAATIINLIRGYIWARSDPDSRGEMPEPIGPPSSKPKDREPREPVGYEDAMAALAAVGPLGATERAGEAVSDG